MSAPSDRETAIQRAALTAFSRYGFARTKMEDIAAGAGLARTALYKSYRNKEHVFRALAETVHREAYEAAQTAFAADTPFPQRLIDALLARDTHLLRIGHSGPHALEISELYLKLAGDLAERFNAQLVDLIAQEAETAAAAGEFELPPDFHSAQDFALVLRLALEGVKKEVKSVEWFAQLARQLINAML